MRVVNMDEAKRHLERLVVEAARGEAVIIGRDGTPLVKVVGIGSAFSAKKRRLGFMVGKISAPDDFDQMGSAVIAARFEHGSASSR